MGVFAELARTRVGWTLYQTLPRSGKGLTREEAKLMGEFAVTLLECLGFTVNYANSLLEPVQSIQFLGFNLDSTKLEMTILEPKMEKMRGKARDLLSQEGTSGRELASFIGTASSMALATPPAPFFYRALQAAKNSSHLSPPRLRHTPGSKHLPEGGAPTVDGPGTSVEWLLNQTSEAGFKDPNRRLTDGLGSLLSGQESRWSLVAGRGTTSHQLPRITSDLRGNPNLCRGEQRPHHPGPDQQQISNDLCEQERRHAFCLPDTVGEDSVVMVHGEEDQPGSRTHTGSDEHGGRQGVSEASGQMGLEAMPSNIPKDQPDLGTSDSRSL